MQANFIKKMQAGELNSYVIIFHSQFNNDDNHLPSSSEEELKGISVEYNFKDELKGKIGLHYFFEGDGITYTKFNNFSEKENGLILNTPLKENYNYFQDRVEIEAPPPKSYELIETLNNGIEIFTDNEGSHGDNYGALLGFNLKFSETGKQIIKELTADTFFNPPILIESNIKIHETNFEGTKDYCSDLRIKGISSNDKYLSTFPYLITENIIPFETDKILEWSQIENLEAEISGGGRDTFALSFFATDYAINKSKYKSSKKINIKISAFGLALNKSDLTEINGKEISENFASYLPSSRIPRPTYFDFEGIINSIKKCNVLEVDEGYIINVKLVNQEGEPDFFNVDMFINSDNMNTKDLNIGMRISGLLWFQGEIA